jgi:hypothetical protein
MILPCPPCPDCGARVRVDYDTTLRSNGRCVETLLEACEHERKRRGVCRYCWRSVGGKVGMAIYCERHRREAEQAAAKRGRQKHRERDRLRKRRQRANDPELRERERQRSARYYLENREDEMRKSRERYARQRAA